MVWCKTWTTKSPLSCLLPNTFTWKHTISGPRGAWKETQRSSESCCYCGHNGSLNSMPAFTSFGKQCRSDGKQNGWSCVNSWAQFLSILASTQKKTRKGILRTFTLKLYGNALLEGTTPNIQSNQIGKGLQSSHRRISTKGSKVWPAIEGKLNKRQEKQADKETSLSIFSLCCVSSSVGEKKKSTYSRVRNQLPWSLL